MMLLKQEAAQPDRPVGENLKRDRLVHAVASDRLVTNWSCEELLLEEFCERMVRFVWISGRWVRSATP
jgi:hypothetical protein